MKSVFGSISAFTHKEIEQFFRSIIFFNKSVDLKFMVSIAQRDYGRILMIMPKKFGNAPKRNKLKRQLRSLSIKNKWYEVKIDIAVKPLSKISPNYLDLENQVKQTFDKFLAFSNQQT
jgi:ribonuclease P protein component